MINGGLKKLEEEISKVLLIKDPHIAKLLLASVISQFLKTDPIWPVIIAPSGGAKSEFINMITKVTWKLQNSDDPKEPQQIVSALSTLTSKTLISGYKTRGAEPSLLTKITKGIIAFKDLTSLLSEHREERSVIMAQFREIYDGKYSKTFGTGEEVKWKGKITIIAGATYGIHTMKQQYTALGERFIFYNLVQPDREGASRKTMENQEEGLMEEHREYLATLFSELAHDILKTIPSKLPKMDESTRDDIISLAEMSTRARSDVERNFRSPQQEITEVHPPEMPTRMSGQLQSLVQALKILNHYATGEFELLASDKQMINQIALDSIVKMRRTVMQRLSQYEVIETAGLALRLSLPTNSVRRYLEELVALEIAEREKGVGAKGDRWKIKPHYRDLMARFEGIKNEGGELTEQTEMVNDENVLTEEEERRAAEIQELFPNETTSD